MPPSIYKRKHKDIEDQNSMTVQAKKRKLEPLFAQSIPKKFISTPILPKKTHLIQTENEHKEFVNITTAVSNQPLKPVGTPMPSKHLEDDDSIIFLGNTSFKVSGMGKILKQEHATRNSQILSQASDIVPQDLFDGKQHPHDSPVVSAIKQEEKEEESTVIEKKSKKRRSRLPQNMKKEEPCDEESSVPECVIDENDVQKIISNVIATTPTSKKKVDSKIN